LGFEAAGVGSSREDEEAVPGMGSADLRRANSAPFDIEPEGGKVGEDDIESDPKVVCDVLKECVSGS
jgi:hypothetical protein